MIRRVNLLLMIAVIGTVAVTGFGQTAAIGGTVVLKSADGNVAPIENINVDCYRTDINTGCRKATTSGKGSFVIAGIPVVADVVLAISGPGITPSFYPGVKPGMTTLRIQVDPGDGKAISEEEIKKAVERFKAGAANLSEEDKKAQAEYEKKLAEVTEKNENIRRKNEIVQEAVKAGFEAFSKNDLDGAIVSWRRGIEADPKFLGSAPVLLNNMGTALKKRAVEKYNEAVKSKDKERIDKANVLSLKDLTEALDAFGSSYEILSTASAADIKDQKQHKEMISTALDGGRDTVRIMAAVNLADEAQVDVAKTLVAKYIEETPDQEMKAGAYLALADYLMIAYDYQGASETYKDLLKIKPGNLDTLANLGIALYTIGNGQESLNYLDLYLKKAPSDHAMREGAMEIVKELTKVQKLKPQKI